MESFCPHFFGEIESICEKLLAIERFFHNNIYYSKTLFRILLLIDHNFNFFFSVILIL